MEEKNFVLAPIVTFFVGLIYWALFRPPLNFKSGETWFMVIIALIITCVILFFLDNEFQGDTTNPTRSIIYFTLLIILIGILMAIISSPVFQAKALQSRLNVKETKEFTDIVEDFDIDSIPRIDKSVAENLANRKLGELEDVVSQFETDEYSTLINYNNKPYRVIPLKYASFMKFFNNYQNGIPGYILIDLISQEATYVKLKEGMKYSPSAYFKTDLNKHIKSYYPKAILGEYNFEIDDEGTPYWIVPEIKHNFGFGVDTVENVIVVNAINGDTTRYSISNVPEWIDRALNTHTVLLQIDDWGQYKDGFLNSIWGQKGVKQATNLYNFIIQDNDVYLYTGITSANGSDQSNIGFFLVNMRTGEASYTSCASVNEESAKKAAQAIYPEKQYTATDPLLLNIDGKPTYCTSLKDKAGLVKVYAFVYAVDYTVIGYASEQEGMEKAIKNYKLALEGKSFNSTNTSEDISTEETVVTLEEITFKVEEQNFKEIIIDGTTSYYIEYNNNVYIVPITANPKAFVNLSAGAEITAKAIFKENYYLIVEF